MLPAGITLILLFLGSRQVVLPAGITLMLLVLGSSSSLCYLLELP